MTTIDRLSRKLEMPVDIGKWHVDLGGAYFEDIAIGYGSPVVISRIRAEVDLNPFSGRLGELKSVTIYRLRLKAPASLTADRGDRSWPRARPKGDDQIPLPSPEEIFALIPSSRILVKSAGLQILDETGTPMVGVKGFAVLIDRPTKKIIFKLDRIKLKSGIEDRHVRGRLVYDKATDRYQLLVTARRSSKSSPWSVSAQVSSDGSSVDLQVNLPVLPRFADSVISEFLSANLRGSLRGKIIARKEQDNHWSYAADLKSRVFQLEHSLLSSRAIGPLTVQLQSHGFVKPVDRTLTVEDASLVIPIAKTNVPPLLLKLNGTARLHQSATTIDGSWRGQIKVPDTHCQTLVDAAPRGFAPTLKNFKLSGSTAATVDFGLDSRRPESFDFRLTDEYFDCIVVAAPYAFSPENLSGPFTLPRDLTRHGRPLEINVSRSSPSFAPLNSVAPYVNLAFITSEDSAFWHHEGIDGFALEKAVRRNLSEGEVQVGGSTITMQTVKNLFLSHERTISRKVQELFLSWHLEHIIDKRRILEIYMNIVEFGPGVYGIAKAAEHFFGKHPAQLNLLESAYLASLLPSPKHRYKHFCNGFVSDDHRAIMTGLLRRMLNLGRISQNSFQWATSRRLQFNNSSRAISNECIRLSERSGDAS